MSREYRIEFVDGLDRARTEEMLRSGPFSAPKEAFYPGEVWLCDDEPAQYCARVFPEPYGFFVEISEMTQVVIVTLNEWTGQLRSMGEFRIVDNDTDEIVQFGE